MSNPFETHQAVPPALRAPLQWVKPPRQARSQETLVRILDAAESLVADKGFEDASVAEIVRRAESSVGAFYSRFGDKDTLLHTLYERYYEEATATADAALDPQRWEGAGTVDILGAVIPFLIQTFRDRKGLVRAFMVKGRSDPSFGQREQRLSRYVAGKLSVLLIDRREQISHPDPVLATEFGLHLIFGSLERTVLFDELAQAFSHLSDADLAREMMRAFLGYLGCPLPETTTQE